MEPKIIKEIIRIKGKVLLKRNCQVRTIVKAESDTKEIIIILLVNELLIFNKLKYHKYHK